MNEIKLNADQMDELDEVTLLGYLGDLREYSNDNADASWIAQYLDAAQAIWDLPCYLIQAGTRAVMWSDTDEAGVADIEIVEAEEDLDTQIREHAEGIARGLHNGLDPVALGYGDWDEVVARITEPGTWTVIRDDDAAQAGAESCWFAYRAAEGVARLDYQISGGTVSSAETVTI